MARSEKSEDTKLATCKTDTDRVNQIFRWMLAGASEQDIEEAIRTNWPDAKSGPLIVATVRRLEAAGELNYPLITGWCIEAYRDLYRRMVEIGDFAGALRAVSEILSMSRKR